MFFEIFGSFIGITIPSVVPLSDVLTWIASENV